MSNALKKNTISLHPKRNRRIEFYVNDAEYSSIEKLQSIIGITKYMNVSFILFYHFCTAIAIKSVVF